MNKSIRALNRLVFAGTLVLAALPGMSQGPGFCREGGPRGGLQGLTDTQRTALTALEAKHRPVMEEKRKAVRDAQDALRQAMAKSSTDRSVLKGLFDKESAARFAMLEARQTFRKETEKLLTPEQKAQWEQRCTEGPGRDGGMRGGRGMGPRMGRGMGRDEGDCPRDQH